MNMTLGMSALNVFLQPCSNNHFVQLDSSVLQGKETSGPGAKSGPWLCFLWPLKIILPFVFIPKVN